MVDHPTLSLELYESEQRFRLLVQAVRDYAIYMLDVDGRVTNWNIGAELIKGYQADEIVGHNFSRFYTEEDRAGGEPARALAVALSEGKYEKEAQRVRKDGTLFWAHVVIDPIHDESGEHVGFAKITRDVTARRESDLAFQDLQSELAHVRRVSEISTLATSLAHELNQPLTAIANYAEGARMLLDRFAHDETVSKLSGMLEASAAQVLRAGEIVRRLREFMSHGRTAYSSENLQRLITEANALALVGTREQGIEVEIDLDPTAEQVLADRIQIQQVLVNLIRNGIDAMIASPRRRLRIGSRRDGDFVRVCVEDSGSGIDDTVAARLFQPFITSKQSGMGVGLSICRTIVEAHRGKIWFEPVPTGGTIFSFTLPAAE